MFVPEVNANYIRKIKGALNGVFIPGFLAGQSASPRSYPRGFRGSGVVPGGSGKVLPTKASASGATGGAGRAGTSLSPPRVQQIFSHNGMIASLLYDNFVSRR